MADDDSDEAGYSKKGHETKRSPHDRQGDQCTDRSIGSGREDQQWLDGIVELNKQRKVDADQRNQKHDREIRESLDLFCLFSPNLQLIARRKTFLESNQFRFDRSEYLRSQDAGGGKAQD